MRYSILLSAALAIFAAPSLLACDECEKGEHRHHHDVSWSDGPHVSHDVVHTSDCDSCMYRSNGCNETVRVDTTTKPTAVYYNKHVAENDSCSDCIVRGNDCDSCDERSIEVRYNGARDEDRYFWR